MNLEFAQQFHAHVMFLSRLSRQKGGQLAPSAFSYSHFDNNYNNYGVTN
jgi:hypothetical protein